MADTLRSADYGVDYDPAFAPAVLRALRQEPPDAVVIDLSRLPSHGREIATAIRGYKQTRQIPILFVDGAPDKVAIVRDKYRMQPTASATIWSPRSASASSSVWRIPSSRPR